MDEVAGSDFRASPKRRSVAAFCRERGLGNSHFFYWKKRLREAATPQFVAVQIANTTPSPARTLWSTTIEVRICHGRSLVVGPNFDANHLRALLAASLNTVSPSQ